VAVENRGEDRAAEVDRRGDEEGESAPEVVDLGIMKVKP